MIIPGTQGETKAFSLGKWFHDDFEAGQTDEYKETAEDVGELLMVVLRSDGGGLNSDWFVNRVTIKVNAKSAIYDFPCNRWVQSEAIVFEGTGTVVYSIGSTTSSSPCRSRLYKRLGKERAMVYNTNVPS